MPISKQKRHVRPVTLPLVLAVLLVSMATLCAYTWIRIQRADASPLSQAEESMARAAFLESMGADGAYGYPDAPDLSAFSWSGKAADTVPDTDTVLTKVHARAGILVDARTGAVLAEKNADHPIPPASLTKLVVMYTAFHAAENGEISLDDVVELPPETWAVNQMEGSSLMFLGPGQRVTVRELMRGMAVASGNDAALALALHVSGSLEEFIQRMNGEMKRLGLVNTRFVEPSGLSELNMTTAREFADFALVYIREYPQALQAFHSHTSIEYPQRANLPPESQEIPVVQRATNKLLGVLPGCDGLKTGFINESGYNLALTVTRNGNRFLSVTMGGPGVGSAEGNRLRKEDGTLLMEWAFDNFSTIGLKDIEPVSVAVFGGDQDALEAIPARPASFTAPREIASFLSAENEISTRIRLPLWLRSPVPAGQVIGTIEYSIEGEIVHTVPLIADRGIGRSASPLRLVDDAASCFAPLIEKLNREP